MIPSSNDDPIVSDHLVFFIHGMGQQYEKYGNMKHHVSTMEKNTASLLSSHYPEENIRVKYVPIEWHSDIHSVVDSKINRTTLSTVPKVRLTTNDWLMDCLYYFSKPHGQFIVDSVCKQCNTAYIQHKREFPDLDIQVHFIGFSLGGIIAYDIASMQWLDEDGLPPWQSLELDKLSCPTPDLIVPQLKFKVRSLFTCGSPIAAGLICRGLDYIHYRPPLRTRIFNIFHPFDPLGYRLEPMINEEYETIDPVQITRLKRLPKIPNLGIKSSIAGAKPLLQSFWQYVSSTVTNGNKCPPTHTPSTSTLSSNLHISQEDEGVEYEEEILDEILISIKRKGECDIDSPVSKKRKIETMRLPLDEEDKVSVSNTSASGFIDGKDGQAYPRTDYVLSENIIDAYASEWIVALKSHFRYWANRDLTLHIIKVFVNDD